MRSKWIGISIFVSVLMSVTPGATANQLPKKESEIAEEEPSKKGAYAIVAAVLTLAGYFGYRDWQESQNGSQGTPKKSPTHKPPKGHGHRRSTVSFSASSASSGGTLPLLRPEPYQIEMPPSVRQHRHRVTCHKPADRTFYSQLEGMLEVEIVRSSLTLELHDASDEIILTEQLSSLELLEEIASTFTSGLPPQSEEALDLIKKLKDLGFNVLSNSDLAC